MADGLLERILESPRLPSLPAIALEVLQLAQQPDVGIDQLADTIGNDPALAGKILRSANSSFYAQSREISTLRDAVMVLGLNSVRTLALGFSLVDYLRGQAAGGFDHSAFWQRSVVAAIGARAIAKSQRTAHPEEAFLGGLLHGLGVLTMAELLGDSYRSVFGAAEGRYERLRELEREQFGLDHTEVSGALAQRWNLPQQLSACLGGYADPEGVEEELRPLVWCVALGAHGADVITGASPGESLQAFHAGMRERHGMSAPEADNLLTRTNDEAAELRRLLELPEQTESASAILERANAALLEISLEATQQGTMLEARNRELAAAARTDPLTGLANRRQLEDFLRQQCAGARRHGTPLAVVMVDIDHFKRINDEYGHQAGDLVLVAVADAIAATARESDIATRYGGDELAVVMPHTVIAGALRCAERMRQAIERLTTELPDGAAVEVTASFGVSRFGAGCDTPEALIEAADAALYEAKESGRNRVCSNDALAEAA